MLGFFGGFMSAPERDNEIVGTNVGVVCLARVACNFVRVFTCLCATSPEMMQVEKGFPLH
jgi:hypothetical protein